MPKQQLTKNTVRVHGRGLLLQNLEKEAILTRINILDDGRFTFETKDWTSYWKPLRKLNNRKLEEPLCELHLAWRRYIQSGFNPILRQ